MKKKLTAFFLILLFLISHFLSLKALNVNFLPQVNAQSQSPSPSPVDEEVEIDLGSYLKLSGGQKVSDVFQKPSDMLNLIIRVVFAVVGLLLFVLLIVSGLSMIAAGTTESKDKAKGTMTSALMGFIIIFAAYWIMQIIQVLTGTDIGF
ncbi:MAG: hypothetical protein GX559_03670 [Candidatus Pacebacteria bacterium]|nr:hypothetical protein [Candidatus Paceibacterota bacterium]